MDTGWDEWQDEFRGGLVLFAIGVLSSGETRLAYSMRRKLYDRGLNPFDAIETAMKEVKQASPELLVAAELFAAGKQEEMDKSLVELYLALGLDPEDRH